MWRGHSCCEGSSLPVVCRFQPGFFPGMVWYPTDYEADRSIAECSVANGPLPEGRAVHPLHPDLHLS